MPSCFSYICIECYLACLITSPLLLPSSPHVMKRHSWSPANVVRLAIYFSLYYATYTYCSPSSSLVTSSYVKNCTLALMQKSPSPMHLYMLSSDALPCDKTLLIYNAFTVLKPCKWLSHPHILSHHDNYLVLAIIWPVISCSTVIYTRV